MQYTYKTTFKEFMHMLDLLICSTNTSKNRPIETLKACEYGVIFYSRRDIRIELSVIFHSLVTSEHGSNWEMERRTAIFNDPPPEGAIYVAFHNKRGPTVARSYVLWVCDRRSDMTIECDNDNALVCVSVFCYLLFAKLVLCAGSKCLISLQ